VSTAQVLLCDHITVAPPSSYIHWSTSCLLRQGRSCPAVTSASTDAAVVRWRAERDGWELLPDGRHLCPEHRAKETAA